MLRMMLPIYFHSQHKGNICFSLKWAGGGDVGLGEVGWICHHLAPAEAWIYIPLVQVKGPWCWGSTVIPKAGLELAPACTSVATSGGTTPTEPTHISAWDCWLSAKGLGSRFTANAPMF